MGANDAQTTKALLEADAWPGPSLVIAYSTCIAHGIDMAKSMIHQKDAVKSGYWPLYRFHPSEIEDGQPFKLDSAKPSIPISDFVADRDAVRDPRPHAARAGRRARRARPGRRRRALALLRAARRHPPQRAARPSPDPDSLPRPQATPAEPHRHGRRGVTVDLRTRYLGLELRSPIVASPVAAHRRAGHAPRARRGAAPAAIVLPSLFEEEILHEELELNRSLEAGHRAVRRGARLLPGHRRRSSAPATATSTASSGSRRRSTVPVIASLNATHDRRLGPLRAADAGRRRRRARAQPLPRRRRSGAGPRSSMEAATSS